MADPKQVKQLEKYLADRFGITTREQLAQHMKQMQPLDRRALTGMNHDYFQYRRPNRPGESLSQLLNGL